MKYVSIALSLILLSISAYATIGWCGQIWPNSATDHPIGEDITVYFQIWKDGVTNPTGRGDSIAAYFFWKTPDETTWHQEDMSYLGDLGNNDEYSFVISAPVDTIEFYCQAYDSTDATTLTGTDQNDVEVNETTPGIYYIVDVTSIDVTVTFQVDMSMQTVSDVITVGGTFNEWNENSDTLIDLDMDDIYTADILFPAGSNPSHEFKFINSGTWESVGNRPFEIDDSSPTQILPVVYFNNEDPADYTDMDIEVHFRVDMGSETVTDPYIAGSIYPLAWGWDTGWNDTLRLYDDGAHDDFASGDGIYGAKILFPEGSYRNVDYKYTTDGTDNEPLPAFVNHIFSLGDMSEQILPVDTFGVLTSINERSIPRNLDINVAPNPFNSVVSLNIVLPEICPVVAEIYDLRGRQIATLFDGIAKSDILNLNWTPDHNSSGIYFARVAISGQTRTAKLLFVK